VVKVREKGNRFLLVQISPQKVQILREANKICTSYIRPMLYGLLLCCQKEKSMVTKSTNSHWSQQNSYFPYHSRPYELLLGQEKALQYIEAYVRSFKTLQIIIGSRKRPCERSSGLRSLKSHEKYEFSLGPTKFVLLILTQGL